MEKSVVVKKKKVNEPVTGRNGGRLTKGMWKDILEDGKSLIDGGEFDNYSNIALARRWKINRDTAKKVIQVLGVEHGLHLPFIKTRFMARFEKLENDLDEMHDDLINNKFCKFCQIITQEEKCPECNNKYLDKNYKGKLTLAREMPILMEKYGDFLERFGFKDKIADKIEIQADITQRSLNIEVITSVQSTDNKN